MVWDMTNTKIPGYKASKDQLLKRLARVEGQVRGVTRMVEEDRYCIDVLTQIEAAEAALNKVALGLLDEHVRHCMRGGKGASDDQVQELMGAVGRLVNA
jgi:DNA-binding FrmR family transcriptional regulator